MPQSLPDYLGDEVINGRLTSVFSDGTLLPVVRGGADDSGAGDGSGEGGTGDGSGGTEGGQGGEGDGGGDLGDGGKKALDSERTARRDAEKARKTAEARAKELEDRLAKFEEHEKALEQARKEADQQARKEVTSTVNSRIVRAEVKAAAGGKLADPNDAIRLLDLDEFEVDDDGNVDPKKVSSAIDDLIKSKPYLAANGGKRFQGGADGGGRDESGGGDKIAPGSDRLRHAYANSSKK